jgi:hypothetical protein
MKAKLSVISTLVTITTLLGIAQEGKASTLFFEDFNSSFTAPQGNFSGGQYQTNLAVLKG